MQPQVEEVQGIFHMPLQDHFWKPVQILIRITIINVKEENGSRLIVYSKAFVLFSYMAVFLPLLFFQDFHIQDLYGPV